MTDEVEVLGPEDVAAEDADKPSYVPTFENPDTFISDLLLAARDMPDAHGMALTAAALNLAKAGMITTYVTHLKHDPELMALNLMSLATDTSDELTAFWLNYGKIREKVWNHKTEQEVIGSLVPIILEESLELLKACVKPAHYDCIFAPLVEDIMFQAKTLKTGLNVELNYVQMRDAIIDTRVTLSNITAYYEDMPQGDDLCEIMASNMTKIPDEDGFVVNENYKITKPEETFREARLNYWAPWSKNRRANKASDLIETPTEEGK